jgi:hypothetical protein
LHLHCFEAILPSAKKSFLKDLVIMQLQATEPPLEFAGKRRCKGGVQFFALLLLLSFNQLSQISAVQNLNPIKATRRTNPLITDEECNSKMTSLAFLNDLRQKYAHQPTFLQAVEEMAMALLPLFENEYDGAFNKRAFLAMAEPERTIRSVHQSATARYAASFPSLSCLFLYSQLSRCLGG